MGREERALFAPRVRRMRTCQGTATREQPRVLCDSVTFRLGGTGSASAGLACGLGGTGSASVDSPDSVRITGTASDSEILSGRGALVRGWGL